jgi:hypothetical protein
MEVSASRRVRWIAVLLALGIGTLALLRWTSGAGPGVERHAPVPPVAQEASPHGAGEESDRSAVGVS